MAQIGPANTGYTCHREERAAGFRHGRGVRKQRQNWQVGEIVNVGFVRGLMVVRTPEMGYRNGCGYELVSKAGARYGFEPHAGLVRL